MRGPLILFASSMASACTSGMYETTAVEQGACTALEGRTFSSVNELECGRTPEGVARCRWQLAFDIGNAASSQFSWTYSDVSDAGQVICSGNTVTAKTGSRTIRATFDPHTLRLQWAGETYVAQ